MSSFESALEFARANLDYARGLVNDEILQYPGPISGCDAQFNHLLAERSRIQNALHALETEVFVPTPRIPNQGDRVESR